MIFHWEKVPSRILGRQLVGLPTPLENKSGLFRASFVAVFIPQKAQVHAWERCPGSRVQRCGLPLTTLKQEAWPGRDWPQGPALVVLLAGRSLL